MSAHSSDSEETQHTKHLKGWAYVTPQGDVESDSSSSMEFVNLEDQAGVSFHRERSADKEHTKQIASSSLPDDPVQICALPHENSPPGPVDSSGETGQRKQDEVSMEKSILTSASGGGEQSQSESEKIEIREISMSTDEENPGPHNLMTASCVSVDSYDADLSGEESKMSDAGSFDVLDDNASKSSETSSVEQLEVLDSSSLDQVDVLQTDHTQDISSSVEDGECPVDHTLSVSDDQCEAEVSREDGSADKEAESSGPGTDKDVMFLSDQSEDIEVVQGLHVTAESKCGNGDIEISGIEKTDPEGAGLLLSQWFPADENYYELEYESSSDTEVISGGLEELTLNEEGTEDAELASGSEGSDFLKLDLPADERLLEQPFSPMVNVMEASSSSRSSVSANFSFLRPYPRLVHMDSDEESLPGEVDDRTESDQSADDDSDLSSLAYGLGDTPLDDGRQIIIYRHHPNQNLNSKLTWLAVMSLMLAIGVGLGHFLGSVKEGNLCRQQVLKLREMQDKYLMCMRQQDYIEIVHNKLTQNIKELEEEVLSWKQKFLEAESSGKEQNARLKELDALQNKMTEVTSVNEQLETLQTEQHQNRSLLDQQRALEEELRNTINQLQNEVAAVENEKLVEIRSCKSVKDQVNQLLVENRDLKESVGKMRYLEHPANNDNQQEQHDVNSEVSEEVRGQMNMLNNENQDLKTAVGKMRYSQVLSGPPAEDAKDAGIETEKSSGVTAIDQGGENLQLWVSMKERLNELAIENEDLKQSVMKLRYKLPNIEQTTTDADASKVEESTGTELLQMQERLRDAQHWLNVEKERSEMWQTMFVAERTKYEQLNTAEGKTIPSFFTCMSILLPSLNWTQFVQNVQLDGEFIKGASAALHNQWLFFQNLSMDNVYVDELARKWSEFQSYMQSPHFSDYSKKAKAVYDDIQESILSRWKNFQERAKFSDFQNHADSVKESINQFAESVKEKVGDVKDWADTDNINRYVVKSRDAVTKLGEKLKDTWNQLKNMSSEFLDEQQPALDKLKKRVVQKVSRVREKIQDKFKKVKNSLDSKYKGWIRKEKNRKRENTENMKHKKERKRERTTVHYARTVRRNEKNFAHHDDDGSHRHHRQQQSYHGTQQSKGDPPKYQQQKHRRHSRRTDDVHSSGQDQKIKFILDPDEIIEETIFGSGGYKHQKKTQKRFRKMFDRIQGYEEQTMHDMDDDDDIDDLYDDLEDFQHDMESQDYQGGLLTWLTCQLRWWKSRFHRKHRNEDILDGCGRHMMQFQIHTICGPPCKNGKCSHMANPGSPLCADSFQYQNNRKSFRNCHKKGKKCQRNCRNQKYCNTKMSEDVKENIYSRAKKWKKSECPVQKDRKYTDNEPVNNDSSNYHHDTNSSPSDWFMRRMQDREDGRHDAKWYFDRMENREDHHHDAAWYIQSVEENRKTGNNPDWYVSRMEEKSPDERDFSWLFEP